MQKWFKSANFKLEAMLYLAILIEGYVVLSCELIVIRQLTAFVGNDTTIISIVVSAVLMPLACGYYFGGKIFQRNIKKDKSFSIRNKLIKNAVISALFLTIGLTHIIQTLFFTFLTEIGVEFRLYKTIIFAIVFMVTPVYLLAQTTPLISNYFGHNRLSEMTGRMLFFSTIGSFVGATFTSLFLMHTIGVNYTSVVNIFLLAILVMLFSKELWNKQNTPIYILAFLMYFMNTDGVLAGLGIVKNNEYHTIAIKDFPASNEEKEKGPVKVMMLNNNFSSGIYENPNYKFNYAEIIYDKVLNKLPKDKKSNILVIGAGGFTLGIEDDFNNYTYVDINKDLKEVSEEHFLKKKLEENKKYVVTPARDFLNNTEQKWDVIICDTYSGDTSIPSQLITTEYYRQLRNVLADDGVLAMNVVINASFQNLYSARFDNTFRSAFPYYDRITADGFNKWNKEKLGKNHNVVYIFYNSADIWTHDDEIYTDNKNGYFFDGI